jgi:hypothetical protein
VADLLGSAAADFLGGLAVAAVLAWWANPWRWLRRWWLTTVARGRDEEREMRGQIERATRHADKAARSRAAHEAEGHHEAARGFAAGEQDEREIAFAAWNTLTLIRHRRVER